MRKVLTAVLMLWLMGMGLMNISCNREENSPEKVEKITIKDAVSQAPRTQTRDAFSGKPINKSIYSDYKGKRIYFCCAESRRQFNMDPKKYVNELRKQGITLEDAPAKR